MGKYYAEAQGEDEAVAHACEDHYSPKGPDDFVPADPVSVTVALADKIDTLVGFWAVDEKPTGSKDPYALRRAALGIIRLLIENEIRLNLNAVLKVAYETYPAVWKGTMRFAAQRTQQIGEDGFRGEYHPDISDETEFGSEWKYRVITKAWSAGKEWMLAKGELTLVPFAKRHEVVNLLLPFFADRLKVQLREQGARHDLVDAAFALEGQDDLLLIVRRVEALGKFLDSEDGKNLLAGYKRATNIIRIEEKKDNKQYTGAPDAKRYTLPEEKALAGAIDAARAEATRAVEKEDFQAAMRAMAKLRPHVDAFFDKVTVNVEDKATRENRLKLLNEIRAATRAVADFSRIEG